MVKFNVLDYEKYKNELNSEDVLDWWIFKLKKEDNRKTYKGILFRDKNILLKNYLINPNEYQLIKRINADRYSFKEPKKNIFQRITNCLDTSPKFRSNKFEELREKYYVDFQQAKEFAKRYKTGRFLTDNNKEVIIQYVKYSKNGCP